jgi:hypothetical protein
MTAQVPSLSRRPPGGKSSQDLLPGLHEAGYSRKNGACLRTGRGVWMHSMRQQLEAAWGGCRCAGAARLAAFSLIVLFSKTPCPPRVARPGHRAWYCNETGGRWPGKVRGRLNGHKVELELELILPHMTQKPMLRGEVGARALRVRSDVKWPSRARSHLG